MVNRSGVRRSHAMPGYLDEQHRYRDETRENLREFVRLGCRYRAQIRRRKACLPRKGKLSIFYEEELDVASSGLASAQGQCRRAVYISGAPGYLRFCAGPHRSHGPGPEAQSAAECEPEAKGLQCHLMAQAAPWAPAARGSIGCWQDGRLLKDGPTVSQCLTSRNHLGALSVQTVLSEHGRGS